MAFFPDGGEEKDALYCGITSKPYFLLPNWFFECEQLFVDKTDGSKVELAVPSARLLGLVLKPFPSNVPFMLNKDLTRFMPSISQVRQISHVRKAVSCLRSENKKISHY